MRCFHGTSIKNFKSILQNGLQCNSNKIWHVSDDAVYCWTSHYLKTEGYEDRYKSILINQAWDSASCSIAKIGGNKAIVLEFSVPKSEIEIDSSCDGMGHANCIYRDIKPEEIINIYISEDVSMLRGYFINCLQNNILCEDDFSDYEKNIAKMFDNFYFDWYDIPYARYNFQKIKEKYADKSIKL